MEYHISNFAGSSVDKTILIVEDDIDTANLMKEILEGAGYAVELAHDGLQAIAKSNQKNMDVILLDIRMPIFSGIWFCNAFKKRPQTQNVPIIVVSAVATDDDIRKAYEVGATAYLKKPFEAAQLVEAVRKLVG